MRAAYPVKRPCPGCAIEIRHAGVVARPRARGQSNRPRCQAPIQLDVVARPQLTWPLPAACGLPWRLAEI